MSFRVALILEATVAGELDELLADELAEGALARPALLVESADAFSARAARFGILLAFPPLSMGRLVIILIVFVWDYVICSPRPG